MLCMASKSFRNIWTLDCIQTRVVLAKDNTSNLKEWKKTAAENKTDSTYNDDAFDIENSIEYIVVATSIEKLFAL